MQKTAKAIPFHYERTLPFLLPAPIFLPRSPYLLQHTLGLQPFVAEAQKYTAKMCLLWREGSSAGEFYPCRFQIPPL